MNKYSRTVQWMSVLSSLNTISVFPHFRFLILSLYFPLLFITQTLVGQILFEQEEQQGGWEREIKRSV